MNKVERRPYQIRREFAIRLKAVRIAEGYRHAYEFAKVLGIEAETYRRYERGETEPGFETLAKISSATGKSLDFLLLGVTPAGGGTR